MKQIYLKKQDQQLRDRLDEVLRIRTKGALSEEEIEDIMRFVLRNRCYIIQFYSNPQKYLQVLALVCSGSRNDEGTLIFGKALFGKATDFGYIEGKLLNHNMNTAVLITHKEESNRRKDDENFIRIYIPDHKVRRRQFNGYREKMAVSV